jgi:hypothetical protein
MWCSKSDGVGVTFAGPPLKVRRIYILIRYARYADDFLVAIKSPIATTFMVCPQALEMLSPFGYDILALVGKTSQGIRTLIKAKPENKVWPGSTKARVIVLPSPTKK